MRWWMHGCLVLLCTLLDSYLISFEKKRKHYIHKLHNTNWKGIQEKLQHPLEVQRREISLAEMDCEYLIWNLVKKEHQLWLFSAYHVPGIVLSTFNFYYTWLPAYQVVSFVGVDYIFKPSHNPVRYCCCWVAKLCPTLCNPMDGSMPGSPLLHCLPEFARIYVLLSWWRCLTISSSATLLLLLSIFSSIRVFSKELSLHNRWPKYWSFSFNISPSSEYSGLISFRTVWFDLLAVRGFELESTTILKHQFFGTQSSLWSNSCVDYPWLLEAKALAKVT